jgi:Flp pilus assembly protein TadG
LVFVGLMMMTLIGFGALVVDGGMLWYNQRQMQNAVDADALAGAQNLPKSPNDAYGARPVACDYAKTRNGVTNMTVDCSDQMMAGSSACTSGGALANPNIDIYVCHTYFDSDTVRVTAHKSYHPVMGFGWVDIQLKTRATAIVGSVASACVGPLFQTQDRLQSAGVWGSSGVTMNVPSIMKTNSSDSNSGNFLFLQAGGSSSAADIRYALGHPGNCYTSNAPQTSGSAVTAPGNSVGPLDQGMADRRAAWVAQGNCPNANPTTYLTADGRLFNGSVELTPATCYRMIVIPLLSGAASSYNGSMSGQVLGFLSFYISNWCGQNSVPAKGSGSDSSHCAAPAGTSLPQLAVGELWGYYVGVTAAGGSDYKPYDGYGTKIVALIG